MMEVNETKEMITLSNESARMGLEMVMDHLKVFLDGHPAGSKDRVTYESWIGKKHTKPALSDRLLSRRQLIYIPRTQST